MRSRSSTIGAIGRSPARQGRAPSIQPPMPPPSELPPPEHRSVRRWLRGALLENLALKFLSLVLAATVFLVVNDDKDPDISVRVPVAYLDPDDKVVVSERINEVHVKLRGPWRRLRRFDERELGRIVVDLRDAPSEVSFAADMIHAPSGLSVGAISPSSIRLSFDKRGEKIVEITPALIGRPQHGYAMLEARASTPTIKIRGAKRTLAALSSVRTTEISLEGHAETFTAETKVLAPEGVELLGAEEVSVVVKVDEELITRKYPDVVVRVKGDGVDPAKWRITPPQIEVTLTGALLAVEKAKPTLSATVRMNAGDKAAREVEITVEGVPLGVGSRKSPERVRVAPIALPR